MYASYSRPVDADNKDASVCRSREDAMKESHEECDQGCHPYDLSTFVPTHDSKQDAVKSLCSGNKFSINCLKTLKEWLEAITPEERTLVCSIHLVIICRDPIDEECCEYQASGRRWRTFFADEIGTQLPNLRSLNLVIHLSGPENCWRRSQAAELNSVFEPLRDMSLRNLTVVVNEIGMSSPRSCVYDDEHRVGWYESKF